MVGRIADKISLFEQQMSRTPRSADVSPVRKVTDRQNEDFISSDLKVRARIRSSSASPVREKPMTIKERARLFAQASNPELRSPAAKGMSQKSSSSAASVSSEKLKLDGQGKLDARDKIQTKTPSDIALKPEELDKVQVTKEAVVSKTSDQGTKNNNVEVDAQEQEQGDSAEMPSGVSPHSKGPSRTGPRSAKKKKSPLSPNTQNKPECSTSTPNATVIKPDQVDGIKETSSSSKQPAEKVPDKVQGETSDEQAASGSKQKAFEKEVEGSKKQKKPLDAPSKETNIKGLVTKQEQLPSVSPDEPDTAACSSNGTKQPIDKDPVILPKKEEKTDGHSLAFTLEGEKASEKTSASSDSPPAERPLEESPAAKRESPVARPSLSVQPESKGKEKAQQPGKTETGQSQNKEAKLLSQAAAKDVEKSEKVASEKTNQTEGKDGETKTQQQPLDRNATKGKAAQSGQGDAREDERRRTETNEESVKGTKNTEGSRAETSGSSDVPVQTQHVSQTVTTHPEKAVVCTITQTNEAVSGTEGEKEKGKVEPAANVPQAQRTESPATETGPVVSAAEPQPNSASTEKLEHSLDDSCAHGSNDAKISSSKPITKTTTEVKEVTPALTAQTDMTHKAKKESADKEASPVSVCKSESSREEAAQGEGGNSSTVESVPSEVKNSGSVMKPATAQPRSEESKSKKSDIASLKDAERITQSLSALSSTVNAIGKSAEKGFTPPSESEPSPVANGDVSRHSQHHALRKEPVHEKQSQIAPASPEANKPASASTAHSSMKKLHLPRGLSKDDASQRQDAPSSWLDVDFPKRKLKVQEQKLTSSGSESNLLDTSGELDDDDFIQKIKNLCAPFSLPPRKHNHLRPPQPPFALPAIREDRFEKAFDPEEFTFGLRKSTQFSFETTPSLFGKRQNTEIKSGLKPARASLADRSMLLSTLDTHSRLKDKNPAVDEEDVKEEKDDQIKVKSRLEGSCILNSLTSSSFRAKRNGVQTQAEDTSSGNVSPSEAPQTSPPPSTHPPPPSPTASAPIKDTKDKQEEKEARAAESVVSDSGPPLPPFNDIKLPDYLEKYLPLDQAKPVQSVQGREQVRPEVSFTV